MPPISPKQGQISKQHAKMSTAPSDRAYSVRNDVKLYAPISYASATDVELSGEGRNKKRSAKTNKLYLLSGIYVRNDVKLRWKTAGATLRSRKTTKLRPIVANASTRLLTFSCHVT